MGKRFVCIVCWLALVCCWITACQDEREYELVLLHTNDSHGSILPVDGFGGMAERAAFVRSVKEKNPHVLLVDAGDFNTGQVVSNLADAKPDILAYNYMGYDAITVGNHEFDKPLEVLLQQMEWAHFPFVTSNVRRGDSCLGEECLVRNIGGLKVGIFGLTTVYTRHISIHTEEVDFLEEIETARRMVERLKKQRVDLIVGLVHLGFIRSTSDFVTSRRLAEAVEGIDILVDGHSHSYLEQPLRVGNTWIVTANQKGRYVGEGKVRVKKGHLVDFDWKPVPIKGFRPDTLLMQRLRPYIDSVQQELQTVIGRASEEFVLFRNNENLARFGEVALGNLLTDAMVWKSAALHQPVDFALVNSGGIREGLPAGMITKEMVLSALPFSNVMERVALPGSAVRRLFDFVATVPPGGGAFLQVSKEVQVTYDRQQGRVVSLTISGKPVENDRVYYVATCDYVAAGKDGFDVLVETMQGRKSTACLLPDVLAEYIRMQSSITPRTDGRIRVR